MAYITIAAGIWGTGALLSYQHSYHAGGPADVHKHVALSILLARLRQKEKPFCVIDLYAGDGTYDLAAAAAEKTKEFQSGIAKLWPEMPPAADLYADVLRDLNADGDLKRYPGSPAIARAALRAGDRLIVNELHPAAYRHLRRWWQEDPRIALHKRDGLEAMTALTPPTIRRGLMIVDPSYEVKTEYTEIPEKLRATVRRWAEGIYLVWYPVLAEDRHRALLGALSTLDAEVLGCELTLNATKGLLGTGVAVVNPPHQFDDIMCDTGTWLAAKLGGKHAVKWLKRN